MSLILKGIDLSTEDQVIVIHSDGTFNEVDPFARRLMPLYKVIQIPKGCGRLIDGDKLFYEEVGKIKPRNDEHYKAIGEFMNMITNAPTILEAEE